MDVQTLYNTSGRSCSPHEPLGETLSMPPPPDIDPMSNVAFALPNTKENKHENSKHKAPPGAVNPTPLIGDAPKMDAGPPTKQKEWTTGSTFAAVGPRNVLQRKIQRLQTENSELQNFVLQRGRQ